MRWGALRLAERYLISLATVYMVTTAALSAFNESRLDLYVSLYILEYFVATLLHSPLNPRAQKVLNALGYALFAVFMAIVALKVLEILFGLRLL
jgi:membrane-associated protease RseP (regulator of RpoE activity)